MKKRFFNALLLGAVLLSTNAVTSCKDYDDDINNLQSQIDKLATAEQLKSEITTLNSAVAAAKADAIAEANKALDAAKAAQATADKAATQEQLNQLKSAVEKAQADATKAQEDLVAAKANLEELIAAKADKADLDAAEEKIAAAELAIAENKVAIAAAQAAADKAAGDATQALKDALAAIAEAKTELNGEIGKKADKADLEKATDRIDELEAFVGKIEDGATLSSMISDAVAEAIGDANDKESLAGKVAALESVIYSMEDGKLVVSLNGLTERVKALEAEAEDLQIAYSTMITSVNLFANVHEQGYGNHAKQFISVEEKTNTFTAPDGQSIEFKEGRYSVYGDSVIIRVNPVNAVITKEMISMLNTQNAEIPGLVIEDVYRYEGLMTSTTRAAQNNNGLWVVKFNLEKDYDAEAVTEAIQDEKKNKVLYAVAVTPNQVNTLTEKVEEGEEAAQRRLVSEYDLRFSVNDGSKAKDFAVTTMGETTGLWKIRNRFNTTEEGINTSKREELVWAKNDAKKGIETPAVAWTEDNTVTKADQGSLTYDYWTYDASKPDYFILKSDNRNRNNLLISEVGEDIEIDYTFIETNYMARGQRVAGFYVTLDETHAIESKPSEIEAWTKYKYEGLDVLHKGNKGVIKVTSDAAHGDVIGFRVFAVNLDGTLVDPDGRAFYVQLGEADKQELGAFNATFDIEKGTFTTGLVEIEDGKFSFEDYENVYLKFKATGTDASGTWTSPTICYYDADKKQIGKWDGNWDSESGGNGSTVNGAWKFTDKSDIKYIELTIPQGSAIDYIDNATYSYQIDIVKDNQAQPILRTLYLTMTKVMPTEAPGYDYLAAQDGNQWVVPEKGDYTLLADGYKNASIDLINVLNVPHNDKMWDGNGRVQFDITVANSTYTWNADKSEWALSNSKIEWLPTLQNTLNINNRATDKDGKWLANLVDNTTEHAFSATYNFGYISKTWDAEKKVATTGDYIINVEKNPANIVFCSWTKDLNIKTASEIVNKVETNPWWKNSYNTVMWEATNTGDPVAIKSLGNINIAYANTSRVNANLKPAPTNLGGLILSNYLKIVGDINVVASGAASPYFSARVVDDCDIELYQYTESQKPIAHDETLEFEVVDCFGNKIPVSLPIKVSAK